MKRRISNSLLNVFVIVTLLALTFGIAAQASAAPTVIFSENFDSATAPTLPSGWATVIVSGSYNWLTNDFPTSPAIPPYSSPNVAFFNSYDANSGYSSRLYQTSGFALASGDTPNLRFMMHHDPGYPEYPDSIQPQVSTDGGMTWNNLGPAINRYREIFSWEEHVLDLSAYNGNADVRIGFLAISRYGNNMALDDVSVVLAAPAPEMNVKGNGIDIANGDTTPNSADHTDFGSANLTDGAVDRVFTIQNLGAADLTLGGSPLVEISGADADDFTVTFDPSSPVAANDSTTFTVHFAPSAAGARNATVSIANDDANENPYSFDITGAGCSSSASITVANDADSGPGSLRDALANICAGGAITFSGDMTITLASELVIDKNLTIDGETHKVTISGNETTRAFVVNPGVAFNMNAITVTKGNTENNGGGIFNNGGTVNVTNSAFYGNSGGNGGGIYLYGGGTLTVTNSTFSGNSAKFYRGGGISIYAGTANVANSTFFGNSAMGTYGYGGGIFRYNGTVNVTNSVFSGNSARNYGNNCDGGVSGANNLADDYSCGAGFAYSASINLDTTLRDNGGPTMTLALLPGSSAIDAGGVCPEFDQRGVTRDASCDIGAYEYRCSPSSLTVANNTDSDPGSLRDAIANICTGGRITFDSDMTIPLASQLVIDKDLTIDGEAHKVTISGNEVTRVFYVNTGITFNSNAITVANGMIEGAGGGIYNNGTLNITNSTLYGNSVYTNVPLGYTFGGGIYNENGTLNVTSSTLFDNNTGARYSGGGGIYNYDGILNITNSTLSGNSALYGGGILNTDAGVVMVKNTLMLKGTSNNCYGTISGSNNLTDDNSCGAGFTNSASINLDTTLRDNGGPTQTLALLPGSSAIDAGDASACTSGTDQRGVSYVDTCDIGAYEYAIPIYAVTFDPQNGEATFTQTVNEGALVAEPDPMPVKNGYTFNGWFDQPEGGNPWDFANDAVTGNANLYAQWTNTPPTVISSLRADANPTNATSVRFTVTFSEAVTGVGKADFGLWSGTLTGTSVTSVSGSGTTYTVTVNAGTGSGSLRLIVKDDNSIKDASDNPLNGALVNDMYTGGEFYTVDRTPPTAVSIVRASSASTNAASINFNVTFSEAVSNLTAADFELAGTGKSGASIASLSGSGSAYVVAVNTGADGMLGLDLIDRNTILDVMGNQLAGAADGGISGELYTVDKTVPTVVSSLRADANPTNAASAHFIVTFSESVTGVDKWDFSLWAGTLTGTSVTSVSGSGATYTVTVNTGAGNGTLRLIVKDNNTVKDSAGNLLNGSLANPTYSVGQYYTIDRTPPTAVSITRASANPTQAASVDFTVTFSETVTNVSNLDFVLTGTGSSSANITGVSGSGKTYTVTVNTGFNGTLGLDLVDRDAIVDTAGNPLAGGISSALYDVNKVAPFVLSSVRADANPTGAATVNFTVTFSEAVTGVGKADFTAWKSGTLAVTSVASVSGSGTTYTVVVNTGTGSGTLRLVVLDDNTIKNVAGDPLNGAGSNPAYAVGEFYTVAR